MTDIAQPPLKKYIIVGLKQGTESDVQVEIEAANAANAKAKAEYRGILVTSIADLAELVAIAEKRQRDEKSAEDAVQRKKAREEKLWQLLRRVLWLPIGFASGFVVSMVVQSIKAERTVIGMHQFSAGVVVALWSFYKSFDKPDPDGPLTSPEFRVTLLVIFIVVALIVLFINGPTPRIAGMPPAWP